MLRQIRRPPGGFVIPAQPVLASKPPCGTNCAHEIKHDGYRMIVRRDGAVMRLSKLAERPRPAGPPRPSSQLRKAHWRSLEAAFSVTLKNAERSAGCKAYRRARAVSAKRNRRPVFWQPSRPNAPPWPPRQAGRDGGRTHPLRRRAPRDRHRQREGDPVADRADVSLIHERRAGSLLPLHPATAPAGSNRSSQGGNELAEAFGMRVTNW
jgi:hypothetical protein